MTVNLSRLGRTEGKTNVKTGGIAKSKRTPRGVRSSSIQESCFNRCVIVISV